MPEKPIKYKVFLRAIAVLLGFSLLVFGAAAFYLGVFRGVEIGEESRGGFTIVYQQRQGGYAQILEAADSLHWHLVNKKGIVSAQAVGIFYGAPGYVENPKFRRESGCIVAQDSKKTEALKKEYSTRYVRKQQFIVARFPFRAEISMTIGAKKVYPKLKKYIEEKQYAPHPILEIYDRNAKTITYLMPVKK